MACIRCWPRRKGALMAADAADARRDRLGVRRDADLPRAARRAPTTRRRAGRCSPRKVEDMLNTVVRQIAFYTFERRLHLERRDGELTPEAIGALWMSVQSESLGPAIRLGAGYETFWAYIGHFIHSPFYVYAYAFGDCLVNSLYGRLRARRRTASPSAISAMLAAGGSKPHSELLAPFGLDAARSRLLGHRAVADRADDRRAGGARLRRSRPG